MYYKFIEGIFKNRGSTNLFYILQKDKFTWAYDTGISPTNCYENQYYDSTQDACLCKIIYNIIDCNTICSHCYGPGTLNCVECADPYPYLDISTRFCNQICDNSQVSNLRYNTYKTCQSKYLF